MLPTIATGLGFIAVPKWQIRLCEEDAIMEARLGARCLKGYAQRKRDWIKPAHKCKETKTILFLVGLKAEPSILLKNQNTILFLR